MQKVICSIIETFSSLRNRNLSIYLGGQAISQLGTAMQATAQAWVVWQISHSTKALGITAMLSFLPMLILGALAGALADRLNRRKLLVVTQVLAMLVAFVFALLIQTEALLLWHIYLLALTLGCLTALDIPAQTAYLGDISGVGDIRKAVVINNMIRQLSRMAGPALAGLFIGILGTASTFWMNGASFMAVIGSLLYVSSHQEKKESISSDFMEMREAFQYVKSHPRILDLLLFSACVPFFSFSCLGLIPAIVTDFLHAGPSILGLIEGTAGAGALISSLLIVPFVQTVRKPGQMLTAAVVCIGISFIAIAYSSLTWFWVIGVLIGNAMIPIVLTTSSGLLQMMAPKEMQGRLLGIWMMLSFGAQPFGALLIGYIGQEMGVQAAILIYGSAMIIYGILMLMLRSGLLSWQPERFE